MHIGKLWERSAPIMFIFFLVGLPVLFGLSLFSFAWYQRFVVELGLCLIWALIAGMRAVRYRVVHLLFGVALVVVVIGTMFYSSPSFNFWLTAAARQRVVDRISTTAPVSPAGIPYPNRLLGTATVYGAQGPVYFDYYKRGQASFNQAAFFVYTTSPSSLEREHLVQFTQLDEQWFFLVRGYAD